MIKYILILIVLYLIFSLELSCFKSFDYSCLVSMKDRLVGLFDSVVNFIDHSLITTIDKFVDEYHVVPNKMNGANWLTSEYPIKKLLASGIDFDKNIQVKTNLVNKDNTTVTL